MQPSYLKPIEESALHLRLLYTNDRVSIPHFAVRAVQPTGKIEIVSGNSIKFAKSRSKAGSQCLTWLSA